MESLSPTPQHWLAAEFRRRKEANPAFSLRAFARVLDLPPGRLSELMSGKRTLNARLARQIGAKLGLSPRQAIALTLPAEGEAGYSALVEDQFQVIADWEHSALLSLMETRSFRSDLPWIARRLGLSPVETRAALDRLVRVGLVRLNRGRYERTTGDLQTSNEVASASLRRSHRQSLEQAAAALEEVPLSQRDITSMSMAIDPAKLPLAKEMIREFRYRLAQLLESGDRQEVYNLNVQLVPVTKSVRPRRTHEE